MQEQHTSRKWPLLLALFLLWGLVFLAQSFWAKKDGHTATNEASSAAVATIETAPDSDLNSQATVEMSQAEVSKPEPTVSVKKDKTPSSETSGFQFISGDYLPVQPFPDELEQQLQQMIDSLANDSSKQLTIIGHYHPDEHNASAFPNIGLARANQVREYLRFFGADNSQIEILSQVARDAELNRNRRYENMIRFKTTSLDQESIKNRVEEMELLADELRSKPLAVYFPSNASNIKLDKAQRQRLLDIMRYLNYNNDANIIITGHTDNTGSRLNNLALGKKRAEFVGRYLIEKGLEPKQIRTDSKGPDTPITNNTTAEGRAKNRRVEISLK